MNGVHENETPGWDSVVGKNLDTGPAECRIVRSVGCVIDFNNSISSGIDVGELLLRSLLSRLVQNVSSRIRIDSVIECPYVKTARGLAIVSIIYASCRSQCGPRIILSDR